MASMLLVGGAANVPAGFTVRLSGAQQDAHDSRQPSGRVAGHRISQAIAANENPSLREAVVRADEQQRRDVKTNELPITVRPGTLAQLIDTLAGHQIRLASARVVGIFDPRVFLVETQTRLLPIIDRDRVLVFVNSGELRVQPAVLVASTVTLSGIARSLLGMQVSREVPWPTMLTPDAVKRLDIRAAILASSVRTPEGVDLLGR
jgi:hypothetical protein